MKISNIWLGTSLLIAALSLYASFSGIFNPSAYSKETVNWALQAVGQDVGNLIAIPTLLISIYFVSKGSVRAFAIWLGTLIYFIYAYLVYAFFIHFNFLFLVYVAILGLASYTLVAGAIQGFSQKNIHILAVRNIKPASMLLLLIGVLFAVLWLTETLVALVSGQDPQSMVAAGLWVNPIHVIDLSLVLPGMILTSYLLLRKHILGYVFAVPWLTFSVLMGSGIVANMVLELMMGNQEATVPLIMIASIVIASLAVVFQYVLQMKRGK